MRCVFVNIRCKPGQSYRVAEAIALREMDSLFGSPASKPPETCRRAIFRDE